MSNRRIVVLIVSFLSVLILVFVLWAVRDVFVKVKPEYAPLAVTKERARGMGHVLDKYIRAHTGAISKDGFLDQLEQSAPEWFVGPPSKPGGTAEGKVGFYFPFDFSAPADEIRLVGYSDPILSQEDRYRVLLFQGADGITVAVASEITARQILGQHAASQAASPDVYVRLANAYRKR